MSAKESSIPRSERIRLIVGLIDLELNGGLSLNIVPLMLVAVAIGQDRSGGVGAAAEGWSALLGAGAPAVAGWMIEDGGYASLRLLALVSTVGAAFALMSVGRRRGLVVSLAP